MKKILLYVSELTYSGSPNSTLRLARALRNIGCYVETWSYIDGPFEKEYLKNGITIKIVSADRLRERNIIAAIKKFDLLIANSILTSEAYAGISTIIPAYWYIREAENIPNFFRYNNKCGHIIKQCDNIIAVSEYAAEYIKKYFNPNVRVLHNCVDDLYIECKVDKKQGEKVKIIMIGTIERRKNFALLLESFISLPQNIRNKIEIHIVGRTVEFEKGYGQAVLRQAEENEDIFYYGEIQSREEVMKLISEMDVVAVISNDESCSLVALEGAMMAKPLLLSKNVGAKYLLDEKNGWLVETDSKEDLQDKMCNIVVNRNLFVEMGKLSRKRYEETSTFEIYCDNVKKLLEECNDLKIAYRLKKMKDNSIWYYDDTIKYYSYPEWGAQEQEKHLYSFDIFDTVITRDVASPIGIFSLIQKELYENKEYQYVSQYVKDNYIELRMGSEGFARQVYCINGVEDKTLEQIYEAMEFCGRISHEEAEAIKQLEIKTELNHILGIEENIKKIEKLIKENKRVVFISDMYLSLEVIRNMLTKINPILSNIPIYVSSECKVMKWTTNLFKYVQEKEKVHFKNWTHVGDNINADIKAPSQLGIFCEEYGQMNLSDAEKEIIMHYEKDYYIQSIIGYTKKLFGKNILEKDSAIIDAHHILKPFVDECIECLLRENIKKLICLTDFGRLIIHLFEPLFKENNIELLDGMYMKYRENEQQLVNELKYLVCNNKLSLKEVCAIFDISEMELNKWKHEVAADLLEIDNQNLALRLFSEPCFLNKIENRNYDIYQNEKIVILDFVYVDLKIDFVNKNNIYYISFAELEQNSKEKNKNCLLEFMQMNKNEFNTCFNCFNEAMREIRSLNLKIKDINCSYVKPTIHTEERKSIYLFEKNYVSKIMPKYKNKNILDNYKIISFPLQECILTYSTVNQDGILQMVKAHMQDDACKIMYSNQFINSFVELRKEAEELVVSSYRNKEGNQRNLKSVYEIICKKTKITKKAANYLYRYEMLMVRQNVVGVQENIYRINKAIEQNKKVVIITDTLYDINFVRKILIKLNPIFKNVEIFTTSSTELYFFNSKEFFEQVIRKNNVPKEQWYHIGNSIQFDINGSKAAGIRREQFEEGKLLPYENAAMYEFGNKLSVQMMIGTARNGRLLYRGKETQIIGNSLAGPMLYPYVQWVLDDTIKRGIKKLVFIARDGYILKQIADIIIKRYSMDITTEYVYGSRRAWRMPSYTADETLDIFFKMAHIEQLTNVKMFSQIFGISFEELIVFLPPEYQDTDRLLMKRDYINIRKILENNFDFKKMMEDKAQIERKKIEKYFLDLCGNSEFSFVELSGTGATQNCLGKILEKIIPQKVITYFLNLDGIEHRENMIFLNYIPNNFYYSWIIENLCRAPHGQTDRYEFDKKKEKIVPILTETGEKEALINHGYIEYTYGVMQFTQAFSMNEYLTLMEKENPILFQKYLKHMTFNPCQEIMNFIGDMPFEATGFAASVSTFAPKLTEKQMENIFLTRGENESIDAYYDGACLELSIKRMSKTERDKIEYFKNSVGTKIGRNARLKKRFKEKGIKVTFSFVWRRVIREILLKMKVIRY